MARIRLLLPVLTLAALLALAAPARAAGTQVSLDGVGDWESAAVVDLSGAATCGGGTGIVSVQVRQGSSTGAGQVQVICDGAPHSFGVSAVGGPFQLGSARATATLTAPSGTASTSRTVTLR
jgi:hypothetical protein